MSIALQLRFFKNMLLCYQVAVFIPCGEAKCCHLIIKLLVDNCLDNTGRHIFNEVHQALKEVM